MGLVSEKYPTGTGEIHEMGFSYQYTEGIWDKPEFEAGLGAGMNYYFTKHIGVFAELMGGKFHYKQYFKWKAGVVVKF
ncbi:MAG: hypothetical protein BGO29_16055 [Bacteroidales bacterium 36-12]|jgi:hypothetical protein|nr:MAG: hypothetical protein BGO29_16055 [Bacteroidales bacterium 36-12]